MNGAAPASPRLRAITGWALVVAATGIFVDAWASWSLDAASPDWLVTVLAPGGLDAGSIGLVPTYLGGTIGLVALVVVLARSTGLPVAVLAGIGVTGTFVFWFSYPEHATAGGLGGIAIGVAVLALPGWGRLASPLWVAAGLMGIPELVRPGIHWGPIGSFTLLGTAIGVTGAFVLWGASRPERETAGGADEPTPPARARATS